MDRALKVPGVQAVAVSPPSGNCTGSDDAADCNAKTLHALVEYLNKADAEPWKVIKVVITANKPLSNAVRRFLFLHDKGQFMMWTL